MASNNDTTNIENSSNPIEEERTNAATEVTPNTEKLNDNMKDEESKPKNDDDSSHTSKTSNEDDDSDEEDEMPLFKYARLVGSFPRTEETPKTLSPLCNATTMGKGVCSSPANGSSTQSSVPSINLGMSIQQTPQEEAFFPVLGMGLKNGEIYLTDVQTGLSLMQPGTYLNISNNKTDIPRTRFDEAKVAIVSLSFDSSGKYLAACRKNGDAAIFELKYHYTSHHKTGNKTTNGGNESVFSSFFGNYSNAVTTAPGGSKTTSNNTSSSTLLQRTLDTANASDPVRFSFSTPMSASVPTCLILDPGYARRREKSMVVGFQDGRVLLNKQGFLRRMVNTVLYNSGEAGGIESLAWRGGLLAWADATGIKLYDVEQSHRLARIDRPTGARASLYPTISNLRPHLYFEKSDSLLIAWGDCLMTMDIEPPSKEQIEGENVRKSRKVSCSMAWELDCIACGAQPIDKDHIAILGLVPSEENKKSNILELQILSRELGTVTSADALVLDDPTRIISNRKEKNVSEENVENETQSTNFVEAASPYALLSSFALPRMEDFVELEEEELPTLSSGASSMEEDMEKMLSPLGNMGGLMSAVSASTKFMDSHLRWSLSSVITRSEDIPRILPEEEELINIILSKAKGAPGSKNSTDATTYAPPPIMVVSSPHDTILVRTRNIDDSISHYRARHMPNLALSLGIQHRQVLRQHSLSTLIHEYLTFLLNGGDGSKKRAEAVKHAARMTPMLLGGDVEMWERWLTLFAKVDGGLFALRDFIPVRGESFRIHGLNIGKIGVYSLRTQFLTFSLLHLSALIDPKLSPSSYEMALQKMLFEIENICSSPKSTPLRIHVAKRFYLNTLLAWGPGHAITERFQLLSHYVRDGGGAMKDQIGIDLFMRMQQTSKRYLKESALMLPKQQFEMWRYNMTEGGKRKKGSGMIMKGNSNNKRGDMDSLYDVASVTSYLSERLPLADEKKSVENSPITDDVAILLFESIAELHYISRNYHDTLKSLLAVGAHYTPESRIESLEDSAVKSIVAPHKVNIDSKDEPPYSYEHIFAMLEYHNLHRDLLDESFVPNVSLVDNKITSRVSPIVALIQLAGLKLTGDFLMKHCSLPSFAASPENSSASQEYSTDENSSSYMSIILITKQLESRPKLLLWYLHLVFVQRPELYVRFPTTSVAPTVITELHRKHFDLLMEYMSEEGEDSAVGQENKMEVDSAMMSFLKVRQQNQLTRCIICTEINILIDSPIISFAPYKRLLLNTKVSDLVKCAKC